MEPQSGALWAPTIGQLSGSLAAPGGSALLPDIIYSLLPSGELPFAFYNLKSIQGTFHPRFPTAWEHLRCSYTLQNTPAITSKRGNRPRDEDSLNEHPSSSVPHNSCGW